MGAARPCPRFGVGWGSRMICATGSGRAGAGCCHPVGGSWSSGLGEPGCLISGGPVGVSWHGTRLCWSLPAPNRSLGSAPLCPHSPSGCTFWGKRPWSRSRRILWQLGMVLGAPMVISLAAGVAVPVITIGIPIYMGRKVLAGGPGVPVVLLPTEPGSPWPLAWTDPQCSLLPTAHPCATPDGVSSSLPGPSAGPQQPLPVQMCSAWGVGSGWAKGGRVLGGLSRNTCAVAAVLLCLPVSEERQGCLELCQAGKMLCPWGYAEVFVEPFKSPSPFCLFLEVLGQSRRSSLSGCQQCLSVTSSVLLSLFVSPIITALTVGECQGHCPCWGVRLWLWGMSRTRGTRAGAGQ